MIHLNRNYNCLGGVYNTAQDHSWHPEGQWILGVGTGHLRMTTENQNVLRSSGVRFTWKHRVKFTVAAELVVEIVKEVIKDN